LKFTEDEDLVVYIKLQLLFQTVGTMRRANIL